MHLFLLARLLKGFFRFIGRWGEWGWVWSALRISLVIERVSSSWLCLFWGHINMHGFYLGNLLFDVRLIWYNIVCLIGVGLIILIGKFLSLHWEVKALNFIDLILLLFKLPLAYVIIIVLIILFFMLLWHVKFAVRGHIILVVITIYQLMITVFRVHFSMWLSVEKLLILDIISYLLISVRNWFLVILWRLIGILSWLLSQ